MRKALALASAAAVLTFGAAACSDDTEDSPGGTGGVEDPIEGGEDVGGEGDLGGG